MTDIPSCIHCGAKHPWLLNLNQQIIRLEWECVDCGTEQMVHLSEGDNE